MQSRSDTLALIFSRVCAGQYLSTSISRAGGDGEGTRSDTRVRQAVNCSGKTPGFSAHDGSPAVMNSWHCGILKHCEVLRWWFAEVFSRCLWIL